MLNNHYVAGSGMKIKQNKQNEECNENQYDPVECFVEKPQ